MYFDLLPYIIGVRKCTPEFEEARHASKIRCLKNFQPRMVLETDEDGRSRKRRFYYQNRKAAPASQNIANMKLIHEIYSSYTIPSANHREPDQADLTEEQIDDLKRYAQASLAPTPLKAELFPHDAAERSAFLAFCELTRDLFYLKTLPDKDVHPWTYSASGRRMGFRREELRITKHLVSQVASSRTEVDSRWSAVTDNSGSLNPDKLNSILREYSPIAPILYSISKMGWPGSIWANKFYISFGQFATFYREMYKILTSEHVFSHHNERSFTEENLYWLDLRSWPPTEAPPPRIEKELISAIRQASP